MEPKYRDSFTPTDEGFALGTLKDNMSVFYSCIKHHTDIERIVVVATYKDGSTEIVEIEPRVRKKRK